MSKNKDKYSKNINKINTYTYTYEKNKDKVSDLRYVK